MESRKNVTIRLHSTIRHPGQDEETHDLLAIGELIEKAGTAYLKFEEEQNGDKVRTTVKLSAENALIMRNGAVTMRLPFHPSEVKAGNFGSGPAAFNLVVKTHRLEYKEEVNGSEGRFSVNYALHADGSLLGEHELTITYAEGKQ
ncbi:DUF1934 domain-containing protein [Filibacter tadaridae]|uniref:Putative beta-barrel protein YwiB n=1 Tax=Filibacter tadaridae TaxID=2483811 RepID=A0A3P5WLF4_9BACL|nr:DUF1934 domain-containing protein [Filibacter tadaridae]VDC19375.1 putative beta-barrel protein YwiB [Filibacter tadaridae]